MASRPINVLFLCVGNSGLSLIAEKLLNELGKGAFKAYSGGIYTSGNVNPFALKLLIFKGYGTHDLRSKSWEEFNAEGAPQMDLVFTTIKAAELTHLPPWLGKARLINLMFDNPSDIEGSIAEKQLNYHAACSRMETVIRNIIAQPDTNPLLSLKSQDMPELSVSASDKKLKSVYEVLDAAIKLDDAMFGTVQIYDERLKGLVIIANRGFSKTFLQHFRVVKSSDYSICARAYRLGSRVAIGDVATDPHLQLDLPMLKQARIRAIQSTPVFNSHGAVVGMISTHFSRVHYLTEQTHAELDRLAELASPMLKYISVVESRAKQRLPL